jgi:putative transposase
MSKNLNGITMQIYAILIVYLTLQLYAYGTATPMEIPRIYGSKLVDKLRYIQIVIRREFNLVHWLQRAVPCLEKSCFRIQHL